MNVLLLSSRFPWPPFTGDRLRAAIWLSALERVAKVSLIAPAGLSGAPASSPARAADSAGGGAGAPLSFYPAAFSPLRSLAAVRYPLHSLLAAPYDWAAAIKAAGDFDATIVLLSRLDPWVRPFLPPGLHILDAVDSLRRSMEERSREASPLTRWFWRAESRRVARAEKEAAGAYDRVVVVSEVDRAELGAVAISNGVDVKPLRDAQRPFDFGFWGRLAYFANADAASWLLDDIWPAIRAARPNATLILAGADAPLSIRAAHGRDGIVVRSPVDDIAALARDVRVALFPVRYGTGQSNKVLEAAEGGCAIVATTTAMRGLDALLPHVLIAEDVAGLAKAALDAAPNPALRDAVETHFSRERTLEQLAAMVTT